MSAPPQHPPSPRIFSPRWDSHRPHLSGEFLLDPSPIRAPPLSTYPSDAQQNIAIQDALSALLGVRPSYGLITNEGDAPSFGVSHDALQHAHPHVTPFLSRILPLATYHAGVKAFIEQSRLAHAAGHIRQAIASALTDLLADYNHFILRLECDALAGTLTLQKLLYFVQPTSRSMKLLHSVATACQAKRGGAALDALYNLAIAFVGSADEKNVLSFMVGRAAEPMLDIMATWIGTGEIEDEYDEFFIAHDPSYLGTAFDHRTWEMRYTVNSGNLPMFLQPFVEQILRAGKYLSVLRDCTVDVQTAIKDAAAKRDTALNSVPENPNHRFDRFQLPGSLLLSAQAARRISRGVEQAFQLSSSALMTYLENSVAIRQRLHSLKRFFFLEQGDYLVHFLDSADAELVKSRSKVSRSRLASLLDLSIRSSVLSSDGFLDDLSCELLDQDLSAQIGSLSMPGQDVRNGASDNRRREICGYEAFALTYRLKWPVKLIVSTMDIMKYQLMFRYIFYSKHVERELEQCWRIHAQTRGALRNMPESLVRSFSLRNRMLQFVRNMLYYTMADVLEPNWRVFEKELRRAKTIDDIMVHHANFLGMCSMQSLLSNEKHQMVFKNICETCLTFAAYTQRFGDVFEAKEKREVIEKKLKERNYAAMLAKFETSFDMHFGNLLDGVSALSKTRANIHLANLSERLDAGGYYSRFKERSLASLGNMGM